jgi:tetratricopeptide (TPR) repeat protein
MTLTCYVSMPFGKKANENFEIIDFDDIYYNVLKKAVESIGIECHRADELDLAAVIHEGIFQEIISSDIMIADITNNNPNVIYELGLRHALRPYGTITLHSTTSPLPFNLSFMHAMTYPLQDGRIPLKDAQIIQQQIVSAIERISLKSEVDSPVYALLPRLTPPTLALRPAVQISRRESRKELKIRIEEIGRLRSLDDIAHHYEQITPDLLSVVQEDPALASDFLSALHIARAWDQIIEFVEHLPVDLQQARDVAQAFALALSRRGDPADRDKAIDIMSSLLSSAPNDHESHEILGKLFEDRYRATSNAKDLDRAIDEYNLAFKLQPLAGQSGLEAAILLAEKVGPSSRVDINPVLTKVKETIRERNQSYPESSWNFWDQSAFMQLCIVARQWSDAKRIAVLISSSTTEAWNLKILIQRLRDINNRVLQDEEKEHTKEIIKILLTKGQYHE